jgi:hypothetical protein
MRNTHIFSSIFLLQLPHEFQTGFTGIDAKFDSNVIEFVKMTAPQARTATCVASANDLQLTIKASHFHDTSIVTQMRGNAGQTQLSSLN